MRRILRATAPFLVVSCGITHKVKGETHHYVHVDVDAKISAVILAEATAKIVIEQCKEAQDQSQCITSVITQLEIYQKQLDEVLKRESNAT